MPASIDQQPCHPRARQEAAMSELDDFLDETIDRQIKAEETIHNGDAAPRLAMWSSRDPVTLFGAAVSKRGAGEVRRFFEFLASRFSDCTAYRFELVAAGVSGDLAYTVGYEHTAVSIDGSPVEPYVLRVTHVYRREDGEWKIVHRHGDAPPVEPRALASAVTQ
jgi:ketosteroid isomerase-like protein